MGPLTFLSELYHLMRFHNYITERGSHGVAIVQAAQHIVQAPIHAGSEDSDRLFPSQRLGSLGTNMLMHDQRGVDAPRYALRKTPVLREGTESVRKDL